MGNTSENEGLKRMSKLVNYLLQRNDSSPFREPVDWRGLGLYDYPKIIKKMMDLGTVKRKLERNQYKNASECAEDIRQIWTNCKTYNADDSDFYFLAESFSEKFEERYRKIQADYDTGDNEGQRLFSEEMAATLDMKGKFAKNLFRLSGMELGHVLQVLDMRCPQALVPTASSPNDINFSEEAEIEIDVDAIDSRTFSELDRFVKEKMKVRSNSITESYGEDQGSAKKKQKR